MRSCEVCGNTIKDGRICFTCMFDLAEEESINIRFSKSRPGAFYPSGDFSTWSRHNCGHCWPFDCRCY